MSNKITLKQLFQTILPIIILLWLWEIFSSVRILNPALFSKPSLIFTSIYNMSFVNVVSVSIPIVNFEIKLGILIVDIIASLNRLVISFILAGLIGTIIGLMMGFNQYFHKFIDPLITMLMPIPGIAWAPIFLVWLGFGDPTLLIVGLIAAFFPIVQNVSAATAAIDQKMVWASRSMGVTNRGLFIHILLPHSFPFLFTGFKLGLARGWRTIIAVELIAGTLTGLGVMIFTAREFLQPYKIYGGIMVLALIYFIIELGIRYIEKNTIEKWGMVDVGVLHG
ncbi:MAG: ABC transporter permease [Candidatus Hodarchaeota archaeon]